MQSSSVSPQLRGNHHDSLFTYALSDPDIAQDFLAQHLPTDLYQELDLSTLEICKDKFIDRQLKAKITDMLYRVKVHEDKELYILLEHQSTAVEEMPLRIWEYQGAIIRRHWNQYRTIPLIYALVYYNGRVPWTFNQTLPHLHPPASFSKPYLLQWFQFIDLNRIADDFLQKHRFSGIIGLVMKHITSAHILEVCESILVQLPKGAESQKSDFIARMLYYIRKQADKIQGKREQFESLIYKYLSPKMRETYMTLAEQDFNQGVQKGIEAERIAMARTMLTKNVDLTFIAEVTQISLSMLQKMQRDTSKN